MDTFCGSEFWVITKRMRCKIYIFYIDYSIFISGCVINSLWLASVRYISDEIRQLSVL